MHCGYSLLKSVVHNQLCTHSHCGCSALLFIWWLFLFAEWLLHSAVCIVAICSLLCAHTCNVPMALCCIPQSNRGYCSLQCSLWRLLFAVCIVPNAFCFAMWQWLFTVYILAISSCIVALALIVAIPLHSAYFS